MLCICFVHYAHCGKNCACARPIATLHARKDMQRDKLKDARDTFLTNELHFQ